MKKATFTLIFLAFLIIPNFVISQTKNGEIEYSVSESPFMKVKKHKKRSKNVDKLFKSCATKIKELSWKLTFSNHKAIFKDVPVMGISPEEEYILKMAKVLVSTYTSYYTNANKNEQIIERSFNYENYLINKSIDISTWKLTSNTKKIGNYLCYEAVRTIKVTNSKGKLIDRKQQVWYSPQIPIPFGPKEFVGFPGLVLQVTDGKTTFVVTKITLNTSKNTVIKPPTKGNKVTEQEMKKITKEWADSNMIFVKRKKKGN